MQRRLRQPSGLHAQILLHGCVSFVYLFSFLIGKADELGSHVRHFIWMIPGYGKSVRASHLVKIRISSYLQAFEVWSDCAETQSLSLLGLCFSFTLLPFLLIFLLLTLMNLFEF